MMTYAFDYKRSKGEVNINTSYVASTFASFL